jgi:uncharacterized membrane protein
MCILSVSNSKNYLIVEMPIQSPERVLYTICFLHSIVHSILHGTIGYCVCITYNSRIPQTKQSRIFERFHDQTTFNVSGKFAFEALMVSFDFFVAVHCANPTYLIVNFQIYYFFGRSTKNYDRTTRTSKTTLLKQLKQLKYYIKNQKFIII